MSIGFFRNPRSRADSVTVPSTLSSRGLLASPVSITLTLFPRSWPTYNFPPGAAQIACGSPVRRLLLRSPLPYGFRYWLTAADLETSALRHHLTRLPYGKKRDTALKRADSVAFMERTVVMPRMVPVINMFRFPSWLTDRSRLAASSGVSDAGVVPDSIGTDPSGAWPVRALPWITLASPVRAPTPKRMSLARTRLRVCWSISLPESPSRPGNHVIAAVANEATLMAL